MNYTKRSPQELQKLDKKILEAINDGVRKFALISSRVSTRKETYPERLVDRRLQHLRKEGKIEFVRGLGWREVAA
jgi:hypothetical protein